MTLEHAYACTANTYRGFMEIGAMWKTMGAASNNKDMTAHAAELLTAAPKILATLQASLKKTIWETGNPRAPRCVPL